jgi:hypothetical protein
MAEQAELIAKLRVALAASGECSVCHEGILVKVQSSKPDQLSDMLRLAFEEHLRGGDLSKKVMG